MSQSTQKDTAAGRSAASIATAAMNTFAAPAIALLLLTPLAEAQQIVWHRQFGTPRTDIVKALAPAASGGVFVTGKTVGDFNDPTGSAPGSGDNYVALFDEHGHRLWLKQFGTINPDEPSAAAPDGSGGVYIAGAAGLPFLARYDATGMQLWIRYFGANSAAIARGLAPDHVGGVYIGGSTGGNHGGPNLGGRDIWIARYDADGERLWIRQFGTPASEDASALAPDGAGGVFIGGYTLGNISAPSAGSADVFLTRYDSTGTPLWHVQFGSAGYDNITSLAPDGIGGVYIGGRAGGSIVPGGSGVLMLGRYDSAGNRRWLRQFGENSAANTLAALAAAENGVFAAGLTSGGFGTPALGDDVWIALHNEHGDQTWLLRTGSTTTDWLTSLAPDGRGGVYAGGNTFGGWSAPQLGQIDAWVARIGSPCYANCDNSTVSPTLNIDDFTCFINAFATGTGLPHEEQLTHYANCDNSTIAPVLNVDDFTCFINSFAQGCP